MICPKCQTPNEPNSEFCMRCGTPLHLVEREGNPLSANRYHLFIETLKFVFMLLGLYLIQTILTSLQFVKDIRIPDFPITVIQMVEVVMGLIILVLVIAFAAGFSGLWGRAFPAASAAGNIITSFLYIIVLSVLYKGMMPVMESAFNEPEIYLILQVFFLIIAIILAASILITLNKTLPKWINNFRYWVNSAEQ